MLSSAPTPQPAMPASKRLPSRPALQALGGAVCFQEGAVACFQAHPQPAVKRCTLSDGATRSQTALHALRRRCTLSDGAARSRGALHAFKRAHSSAGDASQQAPYSRRCQPASALRARPARAALERGHTRGRCCALHTVLHVLAVLTAIKRCTLPTRRCRPSDGAVRSLAALTAIKRCTLPRDAAGPPTALHALWRRSLPSSAARSPRDAAGPPTALHTLGGAYCHQALHALGRDARSQSRAAQDGWYRPTSSTNAIGAASPLRTRVLSMRV
jgi:hypothetical protein